MKLDDTRISRLIVDAYGKKLTSVLETDVAIVGAGPSGLTAAYYLANKGAKVALFERKLSVGGGMWGGGMMFNEIVVQEEGKAVLDEVGVRCRDAGDGYFLADSIECVAGLCFAACRAGATLMNLISVEDVRVCGEDVTGLVINWSPVEVSKLHVDPLTVGSRFIIDATGHAAEVVRIIERKMGRKLLTSTGGVVGEQPMWAEVGERVLLENTKEAYPNVYVTGMACNAVFGAPRMGPIFGGMLLSGKKVADLIGPRR